MSGGPGGFLTMSTTAGEYPNNNHYVGPVTIDVDTFNVTAGRGDFATGGPGGMLGITNMSIDLMALSSVDVRADVELGGGDGPMGGGMPGQLVIDYPGSVSFDGDVLITGGDSLGSDTPGGGLDMSSDMSLVGGDADFGQGGAGGSIDIYSFINPSVFIGTWNVQGGAAATEGTYGSVKVDGVTWDAP